MCQLSENSNTGYIERWEKKNEILGFIVRATTKVISRPRFRSFTWRDRESNLGPDRREREMEAKKNIGRTGWGMSEGKLLRTARKRKTGKKLACSA